MNQNEKLGSIARRMSALPYADRIKVFGSMAKESETPGDIDVFVDLTDREFVDDRQCAEFIALLRLANRNYGLVDPFLRFKNALIVRNDQATNWTSARNARSICKSMDVEARSITEISALYAKYANPVVETDSSLSL